MTINPQIKKVNIGIRDLREIEILPLSVGDQTELSGIVTQAVQSFIESGDTGDEAFIAGTLDLLKSNLDTVLDLITEGEDSAVIVKEMTNKQAIEIAEIVYEENYEDLIKKVKSLIQKMGLTGLPLMKSFVTSSEDILNTESKTSSESLGQEGD